MEDGKIKKIKHKKECLCEKKTYICNEVKDALFYNRPLKGEDGAKKVKLRRLRYKIY
jgi:hypothetical protein